MDPVSLGLGVVSAVLQTYTAVTAAYDVYLSVKDFPATYRSLQTAFMVERIRLEEWGKQMLSDVQQQRVEQSRENEALWRLFQAVFDAMWVAFQESNKTMEGVGGLVGVSKSGEMSDLDLLESMQLSVKSPPKRSVLGLTKTIKFVLRDRKKMEDLVQRLCYWNNSLDTMSSKLEQQSRRRSLRVKLSTGNVDQLQELQAAATLLQHQDLEKMASARTVIEKSYRSEKPAPSTGGSVVSPDVTAQKSGADDFRLEMSQLDWHGIPFMTDQIRAVATFKDQGIIVDWRLCRDDSWRSQNPKAFRQRTENLTKVLNSDLRALGVAILPCVGYLDQSSTVTGYAFRMPPHVPLGQKPMTLHQLLTTVTKTSDVPDLGERFELAKTLVSTVFEILNIGWLHKNIQPKNVLFWPKLGTKDDPDYSKPYLVGFDISRPNQPGEMSEKPLSDPDDDIYRHPRYRAANSGPFLPSFDMYSLGIMLFEIGIWRNVGYQGQRRSSRPNLETHNSDPHYIEKVVLNGPVMDLKRHMGAKYRDAVMACLSQDLDAIWDPDRPFESPEARLQCFQMEVQARVVDAIAVCSA
ncbi:MAG: hypothetical protein Q9220_006816 [cf. Caloplaca sp. 1 TL-2023]